MSEREAPYSEPHREQARAETERKRADFEASSPEMQDEIKRQDYEDAWKLYAEAHDISREEELADTRERLNRLGEQGVEITPEAEKKELEHAESKLRQENFVERGDGRFIAHEGYDIATKEGLDTAAARQADAAEHEVSSKRVQRRVERGRDREDREVHDLAAQMRREDALTKVDNRLGRLTEQGTRVWPWERFLERRRAVAELKDEEVSEDWVALARRRHTQKREFMEQNGIPLSETKRTVGASADHLKKTWRDGGWERVLTMPIHLLAEAGWLGWQGAKRGRKAYRSRTAQAKRRNPSKK